MATFGRYLQEDALIWNQYGLQWKIWADQQECFQINEILVYLAKRYNTAVRRHCTDWYEIWALTDHEIY